MTQISISNPSNAPRGEKGQMFYLKLQEYARLINVNINKYGLMDLAKETQDPEFIEASKGVDLKEIVRSNNKLIINF